MLRRILAAIRNPKVKRLHSRADSLAAEFNRGAGNSCIDMAIDLDRKALKLRPSGDPRRTVSLIQLAIHLHDRYNQLGSVVDLDEATVLCQEALDLCPQGHPRRSASMSNIAVLLFTQYKKSGLVEVLDEAITLERAALDLCPQGHPDHSTLLNNLAAYLTTRHNQVGSMKDLDEAIVLSRGALDQIPHEHPHRYMSLNNLAVHLRNRHGQLGGMEDLDEAIGLDRKALELRPQGHPERSRSLNNLAIHLWSRYNQFRVMEDLDEAIMLDREALELHPKGNPIRSTPLNSLAAHLSTRYMQLKAIEDLDEAIVLSREALELRGKDHPDRSMSLSNLASHLWDRYKQLEAMADLDEAITLDREGLDLRPKGHPERSISLNNLAIHLSTRFEELETPEDLDEAIVLAREALHLYPQGHPDQSGSLNNLGGYLLTRFMLTDQLEDMEEIFNRYGQLAHLSPAVSFNDLSAAKVWTHMAEDFQHPTILFAYETSLRLLIQHLATLPSSPQHHVILKDLSSSLAVDAFSACLRNDSPAKAVELLEQGRAVFWSQLTRLRSPLDNVVASGTTGKELAEEFMRLALRIRESFDSPGGDQHERLFHLNVKMQNVVTSIRELPGQSRFLLPSLFSDLQRAASCGGPVIIVNASKYSCDVLVIFLDRDPVHIPLEITQDGVLDLSEELRTLTVRATKSDMTKQLAAFLRKLWDQIVSPIATFLQTAVPPQSRIWWCPTGQFSTLPLHAAAPYRKGQRKFADLYISSYTPTLIALIHARERDLSSPAIPRRHFAVIGQAKPAQESLSELPSVGAELDNIGRLIGDLAAFTRIDGEESCTYKVIEELGRSEWVHLACHGVPNRTEPFKSAFALHDGSFTIERIIACDLNNPEFAYLSACHTTVGDEGSPDEVIHLASAMQFIGFRSVIGTMWAVDDGETNKITSTFYRHMIDESGRLDHTRAALALHKTMASVNIPLDQRVLYIHFGV